MSDGISDELKAKAKITREDGSFGLRLDEPVSLALLTEFATGMFPGVPLAEIGIWPSDDGELVVSIRNPLPPN